MTQSDMLKWYESNNWLKLWTSQLYAESLVFATLWRNYALARCDE